VGALFVARGGAVASFSGTPEIFRESQVVEITRVPSTTGAGLVATPAPRTPVELPADVVAVVRAEEEVLNQVYQLVAPSVVNISVSGATDSLFGDLGEGSGWLWDEQGHIVTNNHVVEQAETVIVTFFDGTQSTAEVIGTNVDSDLAVIRVENMPDGLQPLVPGTSSDLRVGQRVIAIGNPFGFEGTMTYGIVSAKERAIPGMLPAPDGEGFYSLPNLVQTDAAINPGNSGGPLLDIEGRVIGVNTLIFSQNLNANSGVGFAVPIDKVTAVVPALISEGVYETPFLGLSALPVPLTPGLADQLGLENVLFGVLIESVTEGGPSERAGLRGGTESVQVPGIGRAVLIGGDVVTAIDEVPVQDFDDLINYLDRRSVGDAIVLTVIRDGEVEELTVTLGARPTQ
jgi:2-alkenal reductase